MSKTKTYLSFEDIPVYNFYKISEDSDMRWFAKDFRGDRDIKLLEEEIIELVERYKDIYDERIKYTNDTKTLEYYRKLNDLSDLETKLFRLTSAFDVLTDIKLEHELFSEYVTYFKEDEGYVFLKEITTNELRKEYLLWLSKKIKGFKTKVSVKKANYSDVLKPADINSKNANFDIVKEKILLQESLGITIDIYKCPLIEWCAMIMRAEEKSKDSKKQLDKIKSKR
jgi:hypothetical protein